MIIFPAVDLQQGKAVRLKQGRAQESTIFSENPVGTALEWQAQGARFLHLIDLDGAFDGFSQNNDLVRSICSSLAIPVQLGGGIRSLATARHWFDAGVHRLIIGTMALEQPELFAELCQEFPGRIGISLDAENSRLKTRGWVHDSQLTIEEVLPSLAKAGAAFLIYTDISRDGMQSGVNVPAMERLAHWTPIPLIAAGGVATLDDIKAMYPLSRSGKLEGVISGRALYEGTLDLAEAMNWLAAQNPAS